MDSGISKQVADWDQYVGAFNSGDVASVPTGKIVDSGISKQVADWDQYVGAFNSGDVASVPTGCWISPSVLKAEDQSGKWAVAPFPKMAENENSVNASSIGGGGWYVLKNVGHEDAAKAFLKDTFASSTELMNQLATDINLVSTLFLRGFQYVFLSICSIISIFSFIWMIIAATNKSVDVTKGPSVAVDGMF